MHEHKEEDRYPKNRADKDLLEAAKSGDHNRVEKALNGYTFFFFWRNKANQNVLDGAGDTALIWACYKGNERTARLLLEAGADASIKGENGWTALMNASEKGYSNIIKLLIEYQNNKNKELELKNQKQHIDYIGLNSVDKSGYTALIWACYKGNERTARLLLEAGADASIKGENGWTALMNASKRGCSNIIKLLIKYQNNKNKELELKNQKQHIDYIGLNSVDKAGNTALILACYNGNERTARLLLEAGADASIKGENGWTALTNASEQGHSNTIKLLIKYQNNKNKELKLKNQKQHIDYIGLNSVDKAGNTALILACYNGNERTARLLLEAGADASIKGENGWTALTNASEQGHSNTIKLLIKYQNNKNKELELKNQKQHIDYIGLNSVDKAGNTALILACLKGDGKTARLLLEAGADASIKGKKGWTVLINALEQGHSNIIKLLIEYQNNKNKELELKDQKQHIDYIGLNSVNKSGNTALILACLKGDGKTARLLLEAGADASIKGKKGWTALMQAVAMNKKGNDLVKTIVGFAHLLDNIGVAIPNNEGNTPLHIAAEKGNLYMCELLTLAGSDDILKNKKNQTVSTVALLNGHNDCADHITKATAIRLRSLYNNLSDPSTYGPLASHDLFFQKDPCSIIMDYLGGKPKTYMSLHNITELRSIKIQTDDIEISAQREEKAEKTSRRYAH